jgi:AhpC/TSA family
MPNSTAMPNWVPLVLRLAAIYNLLWGSLVVLCPTAAFEWLGIAAPNYPSIVQCLGMVIGVYGIGYWLAARDAATHWPIVVVGLLGKVFGPIGFAYNAWRGVLPWTMGATILTNDIVWWIPFASILVHAARIHETRRSTVEGLTLDQALRTAILQDGQNLFDLSFKSRLLLVCVRHFGCTYCRETLSDLSKQTEQIHRAGLTPVVIHMGSTEYANSMMHRYGLQGIAQVSDPDRRIFRTLELPFGTLGQLVSIKTFWRALVEGVVFKFGFGSFVGNGLQLAGAFIVKNGNVERAIRHESPAERTDFAELTCPVV